MSGLGAHVHADLQTAILLAMHFPARLSAALNAASVGSMLLFALAACQATDANAPGSATASSAAASSASPSSGPHADQTHVLDPITGEPVLGEGFAAYYGMWQVRFNSRSDAAQFASLPKLKRAQVAAPQVLAAKHIANSACPLTGETLTAAAAPVTYEGAVIGFASTADANQFKSLPKKKQAEIIAKWKTSATI